MCGSIPRILFGAGGAGLFSRPSNEEGAKRREALKTIHAVRVSSARCRADCPPGARSTNTAERTPLDASQRRFFTSGPCFLHTGGSLFASLARGFRLARPAQSSH